MAPIRQHPQHAYWPFPPIFCSVAHKNNTPQDQDYWIFADLAMLQSCSKRQMDGYVRKIVLPIFQTDMISKVIHPAARRAPGSSCLSI
jgi:hypothetical protein